MTTACLVRTVERRSYLACAVSVLVLVVPAAIGQGTHAGGTITGTVAYGDGLPARLASVHLIALQGAATLSPGASIHASCNLAGDFAVSDVPAGLYGVGAELPGFVSTFDGYSGEDIVRLFNHGNQVNGLPLPTVSVMNGAVSSVSLMLHPGAVVSGTVLYGDGTPARALRIAALRLFESTAESSAPSSQVAKEITTDDRGRYRLAGLSDGQYTLRVQIPQSTVQANGSVVFLGDSPNLPSAKRLTLGAGDSLSDLDITVALSGSE